MKISGLFAAAFILFGLSIPINAQRLLGGYRSVPTDNAGVVAADKRAFVLKSSFQVCCGVQVSSIRGGLPQ